MRKIYLAFLLVFVCSFSYVSTEAQKKKSGKTALPPGILIQSTSPILSPPNTTSDCDTINYPIDPNWSGNTYVVTADNDYINGTNSYGDKQKGNFFNLSATPPNSFILGVAVAFGNANSSVAANMSKKVFFRVYDDNAGKPKNLIATADRTLSQLKSDIDANFISDITFTSPVAIPASKKFYVTVDISNFSFPDDSIWIAGTLDDQVNGWDQVDPGAAWEQWDVNSWHSYISAYVADPNDPNGTFNVTLWIFPYVSSSATGCTALPVKLLSFNAERKSNDVTLNWKISSELNMNRYEVERADNTGSFKTVATVKSLNSFKEQSYTVTDRNAFNASTSVQYRLKQVDGDGSVSYSRVINVKSNNAITDVTFMNPFTGDLKIQLNLATAQAVSLSLYDMQGKLVASQKSKMYDASSSPIILNNTANLKSGMYVLKLNAGTEQAVYKVVKQ